MISPLTPLDFLARSVHVWRDLIAVVEGDRRFTYAEFGARVERQGAALLALGVQAGDRVAVLAPNGAMALEAHFAPMRIGAILVMLNTPDGYIELRDRMKDIVISGGENISSIEVEKALADHPAVAEVAIVAVPDEKWGEVPKAFVGLKPNHSATAEELIAWCRGRLAHFKCPKHIEFGPLPRTATGKIRKNELRAKARESS